MKTEVIRSVDRWREIRRSPEWAGKSVGLVATMGALHAGHRSLLERCRKENDLCVLTIFVNPTQFDDPGDLRNYPESFARDLELAASCGVDFVLAPTAEQIYPDGYRYRVNESDLSRKLCGEHRPGHFEGVLTVVLKLLLLVKADRTYFGEKDFQQLTLIKGMAEAFFLDTEVIPCAIVRDTDGLALSSRNARLSPEERERAGIFPRLLASHSDPDAVRKELENAGLRVDYVDQFDGRRFGAVRIGNVRLIDNLPAEKNNSEKNHGKP